MFLLLHLLFHTSISILNTTFKAILLNQGRTYQLCAYNLIRLPTSQQVTVNVLTVTSKTPHDLTFPCISDLNSFHFRFQSFLDVLCIFQVHICLWPSHLFFFPQKKNTLSPSIDVSYSLSSFTLVLRCNHKFADIPCLHCLVYFSSYWLQLYIILIFIYLYVYFLDRVSLSCPDWPWICYSDVSASKLSLNTGM